jgi:hypothetical protein
VTLYLTSLTVSGAVLTATFVALCVLTVKLLTSSFARRARFLVPPRAVMVSLMPTPLS